MEFAIGGISAVCAGFFTNPLEVLKIRMQLQGELKTKGTYSVLYKNTLQAGVQIVKHDGLFALQKGLFPGLCVQLIMNGARLGWFSKPVIFALLGSVSLMEFAIGGMAAVFAGFFTNPLEVIKTRMQLQGELQAKGKYTVYYRNIVQAAYQIAKHDGILALQKGLVPAQWVQLIMNGSRFGFYDFAYTRGYGSDARGDKVLYKCVVISGVGGVIGHYLSNPFYMIKTHLQAEAAKAIAVGHQHHHEGTWRALNKIYRKGGFSGLFRAGVAVIPRAFVASSSQLMTFVYCKEWLYSKDYFQHHPIVTSFVSSMIGGVAISVMVTPFDLILTRLYNQGVDARGKGLHYSSYMDCVVKIYKTEGASAFYKGVGPMYFRLGPHSVLCLMFWDYFRELYAKFSN